MTSSIARSGLPPSASRRIRFGRLGHLARLGRQATASHRRQQVLLALLFAGISASPAAAQYSPYAGRATSVTTATTPSVEIDLSVLDDVKPAAKPGALKLHLPATAQREPVAEQPGNRIVLVKPSSSGQVAALTPHKSRPKPAEHTVKLATLPSRHRHVHPKVQLAERSGAAKPPYGESRHAAPAAPVEQAAATPPKAAPHKPAAGKTAVARNIEPDGGQAPASPAQPAPAKKAPPAGKSTTVVQTSASRPEQAPAPMPAQVPAAPQQTASAAPPKAAPAPQPKAAAPAPQSAPVVAAQSSSQPASSQPASSQPASPASPPASARGTWSSARSIPGFSSGSRMGAPT